MCGVRRNLYAVLKFHLSGGLVALVPQATAFQRGVETRHR
ncbi:MAG: hypothetical protein QG552_1768 [Thermodesulfobacteriota bacterium]|nr:hypothetical protein [Thermodesulfobacteriota bacterium]